MTPPRSSRAAVAVLAASLATLALAAMTWGPREGGPVASGPVASSAPRPALQPGTAPTTRAPRSPVAPGAAGAPTPVELRVGAVGIRMRVVPKGVAPDGQMALPARPSTAGWYRFGAVPGTPGSTVVAGHVDSERYGIGPLARLEGLRVGTRMALRLSDGRTVRYRTVSVRSVDKQSRALQSVFDRDGASRLRVVTCGGPWDPDLGYRDNVVVTAVPLGGRPA